MDQGYFKSSVGAAIELTTALTLNTMQLFPEVELHMRQRYRRVLKKPTTEEARMGLFKWGTEITLFIFLYKMFIKVTVNLSGCKPPSIKKNTI